MRELRAQWMRCTELACLTLALFSPGAGAGGGGGAGGGAVAVAAAPLDTLRDCAMSTARNARGIEKLSVLCPQLESAIDALGLDGTLYEGWREHLSVEELRDLAALVADFQDKQTFARPDIEPLSAILSTLNQRDDFAAKGWWDTVEEWWQRWLARSDSAIAKWLRDLGGHIPVSRHVIVGIAYCLAAALATLTVFLCVREWRTRRRARRAHPSAATGAVLDEVAIDLISPPRSTSSEARLGSALRALVARLLETGRLQTERSLTHRELVQHSRFDDDGQSDTFAAVSQVAEALLYGPRGAVQAQVPQAIERAESLLSQLRASRT